jgi:hypothetical protein
MGINLDRACLECWENRDCGLVEALEVGRTERLEDGRPTGVRDVVLDDDRDDRLLWLFEAGRELLDGIDIVVEIKTVTDHLTCDDRDSTNENVLRIQYLSYLS